ncbi:hypothetical protein BN13_420016 [Nostocoides jenkinsii Ben 74]|uniref:Uncharacterized protein n=1 Tax=Nostocoides jenkinsii Ben 74 TaxID=1193518 RepID=A0A077MEU4_9MICO|nr:hypothetical protein BN13_420016 [Tetrasphaera jenkinsii Ben 74]
MLIDLLDESAIALDDPGGNLLIPRPRRVLDEQRARLVGVCRGGRHRPVIVESGGHDLGAFGPDGVGRLRVNPVGDEDRCRYVEQRPRAGQGPAVVAVGGRGQARRAGLAGRFQGRKRLVHSPARAEHLERWQAETVGFVLDEDPSETDFAGNLGEYGEAGRRVAGQRAVEGTRRR